MGLIKKIANVSVSALGLTLAPISMAAEIPLLVRNIKNGAKINEVETQSKLVCVLSEKLNDEMEQLNSSTLEIDNYTVSFLDIDGQQKYENIYSQAVKELSRFEISTPISKDEFVRFMMEHGKELEEYINSETFKVQLNHLKSILQDETKSSKEKVDTLKLSIENDGMRFSKEAKSNNFELCAYIFLIGGQILGLCASAGLVLSAHDDGLFLNEPLETAVMFLLGPLTGNIICENLIK